MSGLFRLVLIWGGFSLWLGVIGFGFGLRCLVGCLFCVLSICLFFIYLKVFFWLFRRKKNEYEVKVD